MLPRAAGALNALAFSADGVRLLWRAAYAASAAWTSDVSSGALLTAFCAAFSQLLVVLALPPAAGSSH